MDPPPTPRHVPRGPGTLALWALAVGVVIVTAGVAASYAVRSEMGNGSAGCPSVAAADPADSSATNATFNAENSPGPGVDVNPASNTIYVSAGNATTLPIEGAPWWYPHPGNYFLSYGLVDPQISIPSGTPVRFLFINMDNESHTFTLTTQSPPYPDMPMMGSGGMMMGSGGGSCWLSVGSMMVDGAAGPNAATVYQATAATLSFAGPGTFWYLCMMPGHAQSGMYGQLTVRG